MLLRYTDTSVSVAANETWQTAISLSGIARFSRMFDLAPGSGDDGRPRSHAAALASSHVARYAAT
jgi:hypothetical protein